MQVEAPIASPDAKNHPLAVRMGVIAGVSHNIIIGAIMGHFGLMLASAESRMGVSAGEAALGIPLVLIGSSLIAPLVGVLIAKHSLRAILMIGALLTVGGFVLLGLTDSFPLYLLAYGLFFGPAMTLTGAIGPATLVARWFTRNRGFAMGVVHLPIAVTALPIPLNWFIETYGHSAAYLLLAALVAVVLIPLTLLTIDHPPGGETPAPGPAELRTADGSFSVRQLLSRPLFWALCLACAATITGSALLGSLLVPMGVSWGFTRGESAIIQSVMSAVGIVGSVLFGWVADRLGGARTLALMAFNAGVLWLLLLLQPPFLAVVVIIGLIGMHGAGAIPSIARGIADSFGAASFSRGYGLNTIIGMPFFVIGIVGSAQVHSATGSYALAIQAMAAFLFVALFLALYVARANRKAVIPA